MKWLQVHLIHCLFLALTSFLFVSLFSFSHAMPFSLKQLPIYLRNLLSSPLVIFSTKAGTEITAWGVTIGWVELIPIWTEVFLKQLGWIQDLAKLMNNMYLLKDSLPSQTHMLMSKLMKWWTSNDWRHTSRVWKSTCQKCCRMTLPSVEGCVREPCKEVSEPRWKKHWTGSRMSAELLCDLGQATQSFHLSNGVVRVS